MFLNCGRCVGLAVFPWPTSFVSWKRVVGEAGRSLPSATQELLGKRPYSRAAHWIRGSGSGTDKNPERRRDARRPIGAWTESRRRGNGPGTHSIGRFAAGLLCISSPCSGTFCRTALDEREGGKATFREIAEADPAKMPAPVEQTNGQKEGACVSHGYGQHARRAKCQAPAL